MSDDELVITDFDCIKCKKSFNTKKELADHLKRKRGGKWVGCSVKAGRAKSAKSAAASDSLSAVSLPSIGDPPSDFNFDGDLSSDLEEKDNENEDYEAGKSSFKFEDDSLSGLIRCVNVATAGMLNGTMTPDAATTGAVRVMLPSVAHVHGLVKACITAILDNAEFKKQVEKQDNVATVIASRNHRHSIFEKIVIKSDQSNANVKHMCTASKCSADCTFLKRRILFHKLQLLIGLEIAKSGKVVTKRWSEFSESHLRQLKVQDRTGLEAFAVYTRAKLGVGRIKDDVVTMFDNIGRDLAMVSVQQMSSSAGPSTAAAPPREVAVASLKKGEARLARRDRKEGSGM